MIIRPWLVSNETRIVKNLAEYVQDILSTEDLLQNKILGLPTGM